MTRKAEQTTEKVNFGYIYRCGQKACYKANGRETNPFTDPKQKAKWFEGWDDAESENDDLFEPQTQGVSNEPDEK